MIAQEERREQIAELHAEGHSLREIARRVGVSKSQVERDLRNGEASPVAVAEAPQWQDEPDADDTRVNVLDVPARAFMRHEHASRFLRAVQTFCHMDSMTARRRLEASDGAVRDALIGNASWIDPADLDGYARQIDRFVTRSLEHELSDLDRERERLTAELDGWKRFMNGDIDDD